MINWWNELMLVQQIFALIAIPSTVLIIIQTVLLLIGIGADTDTDIDADIDDLDIPDDGLALFSIRGILSMLCITGWVAVALLETSLPEWVSIGIAIICGIATLIGIAYLMKAINKLQSSAGNGSGKVNITVQEKFSEFTAITTFSEQLKTGAFVRVVAVSESGVLVVEPVAK